VFRAYSASCRRDAVYRSVRCRQAARYGFLHAVGYAESVGFVTAELARADVGRALLAMLRTVAGRGDMGALAVDQFMDRRAR